MRQILAPLMIGAVVVAAACTRGGEASQQSGTTGTMDTAKAAPPPIAVEVVAVDPTAKTITVRNIAAVPATPDNKAVEVKLPVAETSDGQQLRATKVGETVAVTCEVQPTVAPKAGVPIVLADCVRVIKIQPKS